MLLVLLFMSLKTLRISDMSTPFLSKGRFNRMNHKTHPIISSDLAAKLGALLLVAVAAFLRYHELGTKSFWMDEAGDWFLARNCPYLTHVTYQLFSIVYYTIQQAAVLLDPSEFGFRFVPALASTVAVLVLMVAVREIAGNRAALLAGVFQTFSVIDIYYAQEARPYALATLLIVLTTWRWIRLVTDPTRRNRCWFTLAALVSMFVSLNATALVCLLAGMLLVWPLATRRWRENFLVRPLYNARRLGLFPVLVPIALAAVAGAVSLGIFIRRLSPALEIKAYKGFDALHLAAELSRFLSGGGSLLWGIFLLGCALGIWACRPRGGAVRAAAVWPVVAVLGSGMLFLFYSLSFKIAVRYFLVLLPFWTATWAIGADQLLSKFPGRRWAGVVATVGLVALVVAGSVPHLRTYYRSPIKWMTSTDLPGARTEIFERRRPGDAVVGFDWWNMGVRYYFSKRSGPPEAFDLPEIYVFENPVVPLTFLEFADLMEGDDEGRAFAIDLTEPKTSELVRLPWPVKRFWIPFIPANSAHITNDLVPWWRKDPNAFPDVDQVLPDGSLIRQDGPVVIAMIPNPSPDPSLFSPEALRERWIELVGYLFVDP